MDIGLLIRDALGVQREGWRGDRPALSLEDGPTWTYADLNAYANRCANALLALGIGRRPGRHAPLQLARVPRLLLRRGPDRGGGRAPELAPGTRRGALRDR